MFRVEFCNEKAVESEPGKTVLEVSRAHGIPHAAACGGQGRCSTCRVLVVEGTANLSPAIGPEAELAKIKGLEADIRLACQAQVLGPIRLRRLVLDDMDQTLAAVEIPHTTGREATLAILFSDIRGFTPFVENNLAYDVVHILNRYFTRMGEAVLRHGGYIDKYLGDGLMAMFGCHGEPAPVACARAVQAGLDMLAELPHLNDYLDRNFNATLAMGIGIHVGEVILADLGHPKRMQFTAIGDTVNVASRIESATKEFGVPMLVSSAVQQQLPVRLVAGRQCQTYLKGKSQSIELVEVLGLAPE